MLVNSKKLLPQTLCSVNRTICGKFRIWLKIANWIHFIINKKNKVDKQNWRFSKEIETGYLQQHNELQLRIIVGKLENSSKNNFTGCVVPQRTTFVQTIFHLNFFVACRAVTQITAKTKKKYKTKFENNLAVSLAHFIKTPFHPNEFQLKFNLLNLKIANHSDKMNWDKEIKKKQKIKHMLILAF